MGGNIQTFPQTVQNHDSSSKPINAGQFQRFENTESFPAQIRTPENLRPIQTATLNVERFPQQVPAGNDNFRPSQNDQTIPERQQIQASILEGQSNQPLLRTPQSSGFSHNGATLHGLQGAQRFPQPTQLNSEPAAVADQPIVSSKLLATAQTLSTMKHSIDIETPFLKGKSFNKQIKSQIENPSTFNLKGSNEYWKGPCSNLCVLH